MNIASYTITRHDDFFYSDEPILDESFNVNAFYGKSYDSWLENILGKDKNNDSGSTSPPTEIYEDEEIHIDLLHDSALDSDPFLLDNPPCGIVMPNLLGG
jgi:hypothetical protein